ncbi:MAG: LVIVD repeat-containing protein [Candidatus Kariarchaeaceae archaeon]|jgi:hypothetical protein
MRKIRIVAIISLFITALLIIGLLNYLDRGSDQKLELTEIGQFGIDGWVGNIHVQDGTVFVGGSEGLFIIDISDPNNPSEIGHFFEGIDDIHDMRVNGNLVYLADYRDGFKIVNVSDPANPIQVGKFHDGGEAGPFDIFEDFAFISDFVDGLEIVNISDPTNPMEIYQNDTGMNNVFNVQVYNDLAYVSDFISASDVKLKILNITDLSSIEEIAVYTIDGEIFGNDFVGDIAYMACSYGGLKIYNISDPLDLIELGSYYDGGNAVDLEIFGDYVVIADRDDGLEIIDIGDPTNPKEIAHYFDGGSAAGIAMVNNMIFVADGEDGLEILQMKESTTKESGFSMFLIFTGILVIALFRRYFTKTDT